MGAAKKTWSTAAVGVDTNNHVLFIHVQSHYSTHDLINNLQLLPINIAGLMYVEGGPPAQLYVKSGNIEYEFNGIIKSIFSQKSGSQMVTQVPNVIGIVRK